MCGIVGATAQRNVTPVLLEGLKRLEYRGYDSAGLAVLAPKGIQLLRTQGKVRVLEEALAQQPIQGHSGIAHTRWATHGKPCEHNAHPQMSGQDLALVHNGIIENYEPLRERLLKQGYVFHSQTDTEVVAHLIHQQLQQTHDLLRAVQHASAELKGAFALAIVSKAEPQRLLAVRKGSPLVVGLGIEENFLASDAIALLPVTQKFIYLQEGDVADIQPQAVQVYGSDGQLAARPVNTVNADHNMATRGRYRHFMLKEIHEQPSAISDTLEGRISHTSPVSSAIFGSEATNVFKTVRRVLMVACGTSYHAAAVGRYWLETLAGIPCQIEIASEYRYRTTLVEPGTLLIAISQSGETADTLAALRKAKTLDYTARLAICNMPESSLVREADLVFLTRAGVEIGVASTKAFTTQLVSLLLLVLTLGRERQLNPATATQLTQQLLGLPSLLEKTLKLERTIQKAAQKFKDKSHALFLGRGLGYPIAQEGALKLKEISYIHAEAYPGGELKHGPLALIDENMPVVALVFNDGLQEKLASNLSEIRARGGKLILFVDEKADLAEQEGAVTVLLPASPPELAPLVATVAMQLLAYHVAVLKGTDVDQPRNLAKSVTVE